MSQCPSDTDSDGGGEDPVLDWKTSPEVTRGNTEPRCRLLGLNGGSVGFLDPLCSSFTQVSLNLFRFKVVSVDSSYI